MEHHELQLDPSKLDMLLALVQSNEEGQVCYQELIELVSGSMSRPAAGTQSTTHADTFVVLQKGYRIDPDRARKRGSIPLVNVSVNPDPTLHKPRAAVVKGDYSKLTWLMLVV